MLMVEGLDNVLPYDGVVQYHGALMGKKPADSYFAQLRQDIAWQHDVVQMFGKTIITKRKVSWYADKAFSYTYSGKARVALPWVAVLSELKARVERECGTCFNSCLLNLYHNGSEGMAWHSDDERDLKQEEPIASLSFGAPRDFCFKHKRSAEKRTLVLEHGSLLVMKGATQRHWLHALPKRKGVKTPRINLTFRVMVSPPL